MIEQKDISKIGKFQKTHALRGELNALLDIDPEFLIDGNAIIIDIDGILVPFFTDSLRPKGTNSFLIKLDGIDSEEEAKQFVNKEIYALKSELAPFLDLDEEDICDEDNLTGFSVKDAISGTIIGTVANIDSSTDNLLFVVETTDGDEIFIPAVDDFIVEIDDNNRIISMSLPDGLVDLNKKTEK